MALSGTTTFSVTAGKLCADALETCGLLALGETASGDLAAMALQRLGYLLKTHSGPTNPIYKNVKLWQRTRATLTLTAANYFDLQPSGGDLDIDIPVEIISASLRDSAGTDTPLAPMTLAEHEAIADKDQESTPGRYYYERHRDYGRLYLDCTPDDTTKTIELVYQKPLDDVSSTANDIELPQERYLAMMLELAQLICPAAGVPLPSVADISTLAARYAAVSDTFAVEPSNHYFEPDRD